MEETCLAEWRYTCTEQEYELLLRRGELRRAGKVRIGVQIALLAALTVFCVVAFIGKGDWQSLGLAVAAVLIGLALIIVPPLRFRHMAAQLAEQEKELHVYIFDEGLAFGTPEDIVTFRECRPRLFEDMAVLRFQGGHLLCIPKRAMNDGDWTLLSGKLDVPVETKGG